MLQNYQPVLVFAENYEILKTKGMTSYYFQNHEFVKFLLKLKKSSGELKFHYFMIHIMT